MLLNGIRKLNFFKRIYTGRIGQWWIKRKLQTVIPHLSKEDKILDLGAGNCLIAHYLQQQGFDVTAVDVANLSIVTGLQPVVYDGNILPFDHQTFDTVLLLTVLHHTPDPVAVLREASRVARRIIIIEDIYHNRIQQYLTYCMDTLVNLGHSKMTYQNKSDTEWKQVFEQMGLQLIAQQNRRVLGIFCQATYRVEAVR